MNDKITGRVNFYRSDEEFGFIIRDDGGDDVHIGSDSFISETPSDGDQVAFKVEQGGQSPHAVELEILEDELITYFKENVLALEEIDYDDFCDSVLEYADKLTNGGMTTSKIRKIYARVMNSNSVKEVKTLRPQFAHVAGRSSEDGVKEFMNLLDSLAKSMESGNETHLDNFKEFMEAVVAYSKYAGT